MRTILLSAMTAGLLPVAMGCASTAIVGHSVTRAEQFFGDLGITGSGSNITILRGSRVSKLSIIGNNCTVSVEEGATLYRIEFFGSGNTVSVPDSLIVRTAEVGTNQIIRRPRELRDLAEWSEWESVPPAYVPPATEPAPEISIEMRPPPSDVEGQATEPEVEEPQFRPPPPIRMEPPPPLEEQEEQ